MQATKEFYMMFYDKENDLWCNNKNNIILTQIHTQQQQQEQQQHTHTYINATIKCLFM